MLFFNCNKLFCKLNRKYHGLLTWRKIHMFSFKGIPLYTTSRIMNNQLIIFIKIIIYIYLNKFILKYKPKMNLCL